MGWDDIFGGNAGKAIAAGITGYGYTDMLSDLKSFGAQAQEGANLLGQDLYTKSEFKPFTVTSGTGTASWGDGGLSMGLSGQSAGLQNQMLGGASQAYNKALATDPMLQQQAAQFGGMASGYTPSVFTRQALTPYGFGNAAVNNLSNQALGMGSGLLGSSLSAGTQAQGLANQYAGLASQAGQGLLQPTAQREQDIYNRIRAAQTPEEQRQALALEERLAAQGRLGVQTAQYGGTPEQLAMAKAREEAKNAAMLSAMQQAGTEQQQALATAQGLGGMAQGFMGQASDLQSAAQNRAQQLSNMGMSAAQINSQLQSEGFGRALQSAQFGNQQDQLAAQLRASDIQNQLALLGGSQQALAQQLAQQTGYGQLGQGMLTGAYIPQQQLLAALGQGTNLAQLAQQGQLTGVGSLGELGMAGLDAYLQSQLGAGNLAGEGLSALASLFAGQN